MRAMRLSKPKSGDGSPPAKPASSGDAGQSSAIADLPFRTSLDDLKRADNRQMLRQHLTGAFPETQRTAANRPSADPTEGPDANPRQKLARAKSSGTVGQHRAAESSSSSVNTIGNNPKRLSTVRETNANTNNTTIDIEQAINLLQELKKTASPTELVALHKALLPTRESLLVEGDAQPPAASATFVRQRSMQPAGLATRGGRDQDLLKKQEDVQPPAKPKKSKASLWDDWAPRTRSSSSDTLAALDLADDASLRFVARAVTPADHEPAQFGAFMPGTLRITNGAASPVPTLSIRTSVDLNAEWRGAEHPDSGLADRSPEGDRSPEYHSARDSLKAARRSHDSTKFENPHPQREQLYQRQPDSSPVHSSDPSRPCDHRSERSAEATPTGTPQPTGSFPRNALSSSDGLRPSDPEVRASKHSMISAMGPDAVVRRSIDDGKVSPVNPKGRAEHGIPRYEQRWNHRAGLASQELFADGRPSSNPYISEDASGRGKPSERFGTVNGGGHDSERVGYGTSKAASSSSDKLVGTANDIPTRSRKVDSGYGSDVPVYHSVVQKKPSQVDLIVKKIKENEVINDAMSIEDGDGRSLYTFSDILRTPNLLAGLARPSPSPPNTSGGGRMHSSLLKLRSMKKTNSPTANSSDALAPTARSMGSPSGGDQKDAKAKRKLTKPMPETVRQQKKAEIKRLKEEKDLEAVVGGEAPDMPDRERNSFPQGPDTLPARTTGATRPDQASHDEIERDVSGFFAPAETGEATLKRKMSGIRGKTRGRRGRRSSASEVTEDAAQRNWNMSQKRNQSSCRSGRSGSVTPKRRSLDLRWQSRAHAEENDAEDIDGEHMPAFMDMSSVMRALGTSPYDPSTSMIRRTMVVPGATLPHQPLQSPHQITTGLPRSKSGGFIGMDASVAAELARMRSRDMAINNNEPVFDRPRMATPKGPRGERQRLPAALLRSPSLDNQIPTRQGDRASVYFSPIHRPHSMYAESIPPMPEIPADAQKKASRVEEVLSKRAKDSLRSSPVASARNSQEYHVPIAEAVRIAMAKGRAYGAKQQGVKRLTEVKTATGNQTQPIDGGDEAPKPVQSAAYGGSILIGVEAELVSPGGRPSVFSDDDDGQRADWGGWGEQAALWRKRRQSAGKSLGHTFEMSDDDGDNNDENDGDHAHGRADSPPPDAALPHSPSIVVSRYITPLTSESSGRANARDRSSDAAAQHASAYAALIGDDKENLPDREDGRRNTDTGTGTILTSRCYNDSAPRPATTHQHQQHQQQQRSLPRPDSGVPSPNSHSYTPVARDRSPGGRVRTASGNFKPYSPAEAVHVERSRALSLAKLNGEPVPPPPPPPPQHLVRHSKAAKSLDAARRPPSSSPSPSPSPSSSWLMDPPRPLDNATAGPRAPRGSSDSIRRPLSNESPALSPSASSSSMILDRYGGGLAYGYERGVGIGGSAGTTTSSSRRTPGGGADDGGRTSMLRKSAQLSEEYGIDLTDVPVFLRKIS